MGTTLSVKDAATYEFVAESVAETDLSMTQTVKEAILARLEHVRAERVE
jgi:hypothetical protein